MRHLDIYLHQLGAPLRLKLWVFSLLGVYFLARAVWRVDAVELPFHYVLLVVPGVMMAIALQRLEKTELIRINGLLAQRLNLFAVLLIIGWLASVKLWLPGVVALVADFPNEALQMATAGFLLSRVVMTWRRIEQFLGRENRRHSLHLVPQI
ncbi:hypothetical protein Q4485_04975 [Granulosicoccaceae sp. 1_MG-2023]|nr:hypothetical protein [Granulosicoccaceae sp. 1_MG-2023]